MNGQQVVWRGTVVAIWTVLAVVYDVTAGCGGAGGTTASAGTSSTTSPSPRANATRLPVAGAELPVKMGSRAPSLVAMVETTTGGYAKLRNGTQVYRDQMSDPRVSGTRTVTIDANQRADKSADTWGTVVIVNDRGTWKGEWHGMVAKGGVTRYAFSTLKGAGGYEGLAYVNQEWFGQNGEPIEPGVPVAAAGWIESADGGPVAAPSDAGQAPPGWIPVTGDVAYLRTGESWFFTQEMSDKRLSGAFKATITKADQPRPDKSTDAWATYVVTTDGGSWVSSSAFMSRGIGGEEHFSYGVAKGAGAYAGLAFHSQWHFFEPLTPGERFPSTGWIERAP
jgi:hypothetical protein